jgi:hypothetical protein
MNGVYFMRFRSGDDAGNIEIGFDRAFANADLVGFVSLKTVKGEAIFLGIDGDGAQTEFIGGAENTDSAPSK